MFINKSWSSLYLLLVIAVNLFSESSGFGSIHARPPIPELPKCIYFTGAGVYFWWQAGAAKYIRENFELKDYPVVGASAGSLTATLLLLGVDFDRAAEAAKEIVLSRRVYERKHGLNGVFGGILREWLEAVLPVDYEPYKVEGMEIALSPASLTSVNNPKLVRGFESRGELINACMASCHVPLFLDGKAFTVYRDETVFDGSFWYFVTKDRMTGLPLPDEIDKSEIFWVDYTDDDNFMQSVSGNFLELMSLESVPRMMSDGYSFMAREDALGRIPLKRLNDDPQLSPLHISESAVISVYNIPTYLTTTTTTTSTTTDSIAPPSPSDFIIADSTDKKKRRGSKRRMIRDKFRESLQVINSHLPPLQPILDWIPTPKAGISRIKAATSRGRRK